MDFNYYYHRQQVEYMRAARADSKIARVRHRELAEAYGRLIEDERQKRWDERQLVFCK